MDSTSNDSELVELFTPCNITDYYNYNETGCLYNDSDDDNPGSRPLLLDDIPYVVLINGLLSPLLVGFTLVTNICVCAVLVRPNMRSSTNVLLVAMAVSDTLTGVCPLPAYFRFYSGGDGAHRDWVPYSWCFAYYCLTDHLPTIFHTASVWLTVALAVQRYVYVCRAVDARRWCTVQNSLRAVVVVYVVAVLYQVSRFLEMHYTEVFAESLTLNDTDIAGCHGEYWPFLGPYLDAYFNIYYWFRVVAVHLLPCSALVALNAALVLAMRRAQRRRRMLLAQNRKTESRRLAESNVTTMMLVAVVGVFLIVEFPLAGIFIIVIVENTWNLTIVEPSNMATSTLFVNLFILLSYPVNFFIYCGMSRQFRSTLKAVFLCRADDITSPRPGKSLIGCGAGEEASRYVSLTNMENGKTANMTTRTTSTRVVDILDS